jgi:hypothetical protein
MMVCFTACNPYIKWVTASRLEALIIDATELVVDSWVFLVDMGFEILPLRTL